MGLDGKPRALHVQESLASIDYNDFEPSLVRSEFRRTGPVKARPLVHNPFFTVELYEADAGAALPLPAHKMQILAIVEGRLEVGYDDASISLAAGGFGLIPACLGQCTVQLRTATKFLRVEAGSA
jgi:mannose-6-phosphate isomerase